MALLSFFHWALQFISSLCRSPPSHCNTILCVNFYITRLSKEQQNTVKEKYLSISSLTQLWSDSQAYKQLKFCTHQIPFPRMQILQTLRNCLHSTFFYQHFSFNITQTHVFSLTLSAYMYASCIILIKIFTIWEILLPCKFYLRTNSKKAYFLLVMPSYPLNRQCTAYNYSFAQVTNA